MSKTDPHSPPNQSPETPLLLYEDGLPILDEEMRKHGYAPPDARADEDGPPS